MNHTASNCTIISERFGNNVEGRYRGLNWGTICYDEWGELKQTSLDDLPATKHEYYLVKRDVPHWMNALLIT
jgi:hypothetical protein